MRMLRAGARRVACRRTCQPTQPPAHRRVRLGLSVVLINCLLPPSLLSNASYLTPGSLLLAHCVRRPSCRSLSTTRFVPLPLAHPRVKQHYAPPGGCVARLWSCAVAVSSDQTWLPGVRSCVIGLRACGAHITGHLGRRRWHSLRHCMGCASLGRASQCRSGSALALAAQGAQ